MAKELPRVRHLIRQIAFQTLFQLETNPINHLLNAVYFAVSDDSAPDKHFASVEEILQEGLPKIYQKKDIVRDSSIFLNDLLNGVKEHQRQIDQLIDENMSAWNISRINRTHLIILRIAAYELLYMPETDASIVMNEAIELAKEFSDEKSSKFINGVLQGIQNSKKEA